MIKHFLPSLFISLVGLAAGAYWGGTGALILVGLLAILEVSLSFDNAVVNAAVLKHMEVKWQKRFLTWGILIAVFGMRLVLPVLIVAISSGIGIIQTMQLAVYSHEAYAEHVLNAHVPIAAFGGMFLLLVFLHFLCDPEKDHHWLEWLEQRLVKLGKLESVELMIALSVLVLLAMLTTNAVLLPGIIGIILYVGIKTTVGLVVGEDAGAIAAAIGRAGIIGFLYLEILDMSFSLDGVVGAFAMSNDIVIIMIGLGVGAVFVRSMTVYLVVKGTLEELVYLEHGAHWAIGSLAFLMFASIFMPVPHIITGLIGVTFIGLSVVSSLKHRRLN